ncbi:MAG: hypothetical protein OEQ28_10505, partial [Acidobacteriota bacterium]|nr:hypothetical protein [Acidobacteriota bacterium]
MNFESLRLVKIESHRLFVIGLLAVLALFLASAGSARAQGVNPQTARVLQSASDSIQAGRFEAAEKILRAHLSKSPR